MAVGVIGDPLPGPFRAFETGVTEHMASMQETDVPYDQGVQTRWMVRFEGFGQWTLEAPIAPMDEVITFQIPGGMDATFASVLSKLKHANAQMGRDIGYSISRPRLDGTGSQWNVSVPSQNFAQFGEGPHDWMEQLLTEVYGHADMQSINGGSHRLHRVREERAVRGPDRSRHEHAVVLTIRVSRRKRRGRPPGRAPSSFPISFPSGPTTPRTS